MKTVLVALALATPSQVLATLSLVLATPSLAQPLPAQPPATCGVRPLVMGCANAANLAAMLADPADLESPRAAAPAMGPAPLLPIERYQTGKPLALPMVDTQGDGGATPE